MSFPGISERGEIFLNHGKVLAFHLLPHSLPVSLLQPLHFISLIALCSSKPFFKKALILRPWAFNTNPHALRIGEKALSSTVLYHWTLTQVSVE